MVGASVICEAAFPFLLQPAVLLTDLGLPDGEGSELIREAVATNDKTLVMAITVFGDESHVVSAIEAGALGYILKGGTSEKIARSILDLIAGGSPISPPIARSLLRNGSRQISSNPPGRTRNSELPGP